MIYLDYNATAPVRPAVRDAMVAALADHGNPSSVHQAGVKARRVVERARHDLATFTGGLPGNIVFTSGGTEANNAVLQSFKDRPVFASAIEHDSILNAPTHKTLIPVDHKGVVDLHALENMLAAAERPGLVSVMMVNNETGVIQPVADVARLAHEYGFEMHCDAVQAVGKVSLDMPNLGVDLMTLCFHKIGGPPGLGAIVTNDLSLLPPFQFGGAQENRRRAGTENVPALAGLSALLDDPAVFCDEQDRLESLRNKLETSLPDSILIGHRSKRVANTACVVMPRVAAETQIMAFDLAGIAVSAGSACSSGKVSPSHVLAAMNVAPHLAGSAIRVSLGWGTEEKDINAFTAEWQRLWGRVGKKQVA